MDELIQQAHSLYGINLNSRQAAMLGRYETELIEWNQNFNLTAIRDPRAIRSKHFLDSFSCVLAWKGTHPNRLIDIGTGAGFPGIPLKILFPQMQVTLVESVQKKASFCQHVVDMLNLENCEVLTARAEEVGQMPAHRESYDLAVARAVAELSILAEYLLPLARVGGRMLAQKGHSGPAETQQAEQALKILGGNTRQLIPVHLPGVAEERYLVIIDKIAATPPKYPRKAGIPAKKPL